MQDAGMQLGVCMLSCDALIVHMYGIDRPMQMYNMSCGSSALNCLMHQMDQIPKSSTAGNMAREFRSELRSKVFW